MIAVKIVFVGFFWLTKQKFYQTPVTTRPTCLHGTRHRMRLLSVRPADYFPQPESITVLCPVQRHMGVNNCYLPRVVTR